MEDIVLKMKNNLTINSLEYLQERFLNYIDVTDKTVNSYRVGLIQFFLYLKNNNIHNPIRNDVVNFREYLKETHKPNTVNTYLVAVKNFYSWLEYEGIAKDITKKVKGIKLERKHLKRSLSKEEIDKILSVCKNIKEELLIKLMIICGLRVNEVRNIMIDDFYNDGGVIMLNILGKGRGGLKQDSVKIDDKLFELISRYCQEYNVKDYLFYSTSNNSFGKAVSGVTIRTIVNELFERAGLDTDLLSPHSTRHTTVDLLFDNNIPIQDVSEYVRHKDISTTMLYKREFDRRNSKNANILSSIVCGDM